MMAIPSIEPKLAWQRCNCCCSESNALPQEGLIRSIVASRDHSFDCRQMNERYNWIHEMHKVAEDIVECLPCAELLQANGQC